MWKIIVGFTLICLAIRVDSDGNSIQCRDEAGKPVDWFVMYKIPKIIESKNPSIKEGMAYLYMTSKTVEDGWKLSTKNVTSENSIPARTLSVLYDDAVAKKNAWIIYNDQVPNAKSSNSKNGHAKGVVIANSHQGLWLIHSVPSFPPIPRTGNEKKKGKNSADESEKDNSTADIKEDLPIGEYAYPKSGMNYGQSFLCISVNSSQMNVISNQLIYNQIISYKYNLPKNLEDDYPVFMNITKLPKIKKPPYNRETEFESIGGMKFISFAKTDKWQKDLYDDFVAPQLETNMLAETWLNGRGKLPSECNGSQVLNVQSVVLNAAQVDFKSSKDHSKWAVAESNEENKNWVCIGDINRADTQFNRGGGTVCVNSPDLWKNYRNAVSEVESCPRKSTGILKSVMNWFSKKIG